MNYRERTKKDELWRKLKRENKFSLAGTLSLYPKIKGGIISMLTEPLTLPLINRIK